MKDTKLTKDLVFQFLAKHRLMTVATYGAHPWIASVYYSFDKDLNLYFLSSPETLHAKQIQKNQMVAVSIAASDQLPSDLKQGLQIYGVAKQISITSKIKHALRHWKSTLNISDPKLTYKNMVAKVIKGKMYCIIPKKIKLFDQKLFDVEDGYEPMLEL